MIRKRDQDRKIYVCLSRWKIPTVEVFYQARSDEEIGHGSIATVYAWIKQKEAYDTLVEMNLKADNVIQYRRFYERSHRFLPRSSMRRGLLPGDVVIFIIFDRIEPEK